MTVGHNISQFNQNQETNISGQAVEIDDNIDLEVGKYKLFFLMK